MTNPVRSWAQSQNEIEPPEPGAYAKCFLCALERPWGTWDSTTGAVVCVDCRDASRLMPTLVQHRLLYGYINFSQERWTANCSCGWHDTQDTRETSNLAAFDHMTATLNALNDFGVTHYRDDVKGKQ